VLPDSRLRLTRPNHRNHESDYETFPGALAEILSCRHRDLERLELLEVDLLRQLGDQRDTERDAEWESRFGRLCEAAGDTHGGVIPSLGFRGAFSIS
jgi:hypothetical protein